MSSVTDIKGALTCKQQLSNAILYIKGICLHAKVAIKYRKVPTIVLDFFPVVCLTEQINNLFDNICFVLLQKFLNWCSYQ